jgi:hypothetical protein
MSLDDPRAGTHLIAMAERLALTDGAVLEVGMGAWSTPFLLRYCLASGRELVSVDDDRQWFEAHAHPGAELVSYDTALPKLAERNWSVVLIDHSPGSRRARDTLLFLSTATYILVHDWRSAEVTDPFQPILAKWSWSDVIRDTMVLGARWR